MNGRRGLLAERQDARRIERDQRPHLHPRPARGLRALGGARQSGLELRDVLPYFRKLEHNVRGDERVARHRRPAVGVGHRREARARRGADRGRRRARHPRQPRFQRRDAGRRRLLPADDPPRLPLLDGDRLPAPGARGAPTSRIETGAQATRIAFEGRRATAVAYRRDGRDVTAHGAARGDPRGRRIAVAAAAAAVRRRAARRCCAIRDPGRPRASGRRREPAGPPAGARDLPLHEADHDQRRAEIEAAHAGDGRALRPHADGADGDRDQPGRHVRAHRPRARPARRPVPPRDAVLRHGGLARAYVLRLHAVGVPAAPAVARARADQVARPVRRARDAAELPVGARRPRDDRPRRPARAEARRDARARALRRRRVPARPGRDHRRGDPRVRARQGRDDLPSGRAPAGWVLRRIRWRSSTPNCKCTASPDCASSIAASCPRWSPATPTRRSS